MVLQVSLIIPPLNRAEVLRRTLRSIVAVVHPSDSVEIIVVDNASVDRTAEVCREVRMRFPQYEWRYFYEPVPGLLSGRHRGAKEAQGEILSFLDDDVLFAAEGSASRIRSSAATIGSDVRMPVPISDRCVTMKTVPSGSTPR